MPEIDNGLLVTSVYTQFEYGTDLQKPNIHIIKYGSKDWHKNIASHLFVSPQYTSQYILLKKPTKMHL